MKRNKKRRGKRLGRGNVEERKRKDEGSSGFHYGRGRGRKNEEKMRKEGGSSISFRKRKSKGEDRFIARETTI